MKNRKNVYKGVTCFLISLSFHIFFLTFNRNRILFYIYEFISSLWKRLMFVIALRCRCKRNNWHLTDWGLLAFSLKRLNTCPRLCRCQKPTQKAHFFLLMCHLHSPLLLMCKPLSVNDSPLCLSSKGLLYSPPFSSGSWQLSCKTTEYH